MINLKIYKNIEIGLIQDVIQRAFGLPVVAEVDVVEGQKPKPYDWKIPSRERGYAYTYMTDMDGNHLFERHLTNENGDKFFVIPNFKRQEFAFLITCPDYELVNNVPVKNFYFLNSNSYTAMVAEKCLKLFGGQMWVDDKLVKEVPFSKLIENTHIENDDSYYWVKDREEEIKPVNFKELKDGIKKYSSLNNSDAALEVVSVLYSHLESHNAVVKKNVIYKEKKKSRY